LRLRGGLLGLCSGALSLVDASCRFLRGGIGLLRGIQQLLEL
jgi:hypothetical protein